MNSRFNENNFRKLVDELSENDEALQSVVARYGYPPMWQREEGFATLVLIILEQQVSLASAFAAFTRLKNYIDDITPAAVLQLSDDELRACSFSRQKTKYVRDLADKITSGKLDPGSLGTLPAESVREQLKEVKGIGDWTVDVYLMFCLQHADHFPLGDVALVNSLRHEKGLDKTTSREQLSAVSEKWKPWRTIASMILWHAYIRRKSMKLPDSYKK